MSALRLYDYGPSANCYKVRLLLGQLGCAYERVPVDIFDGDTLTEDYGKLNPLRSTPVLRIDDERTLIESNAILVYLADGTAHGGADALERAEIVRWLIYEQSDVMPAIGGLRFRLLTGRLSPEDPDAVRRRKAGEETLSLLDEHLSRSDFLVAGRYTIADIAVYGYTHVAADAGYELDRRPAVAAWIRRVAEQPGHFDDLEPYPDNAAPGRGRSIYG